MEACYTKIDKKKYIVSEDQKHSAEKSCSWNCRNSIVPIGYLCAYNFHETRGFCELHTKHKQHAYDLSVQLKV